MKKFFLMMIPMLGLIACGSPKQQAPALDLTNLDTTVSPKVDFYQYATGGWQVKNPLKPEFSRYGSFDAIAENTQKQLNDLFAAMTEMKTVKGSVEQKISDLYKMGLDSVRRNNDGAAPILEGIAAIRALDSKDALFRKLGAMSKTGDGGFYGAYVAADLTDSNNQVLYLGQGGLGMGDRDYYLDPANAELKAGYRAFLEKVFGLSGLEDAASLADKALSVEDAMAAIFWPKERLRDVAANYNPMSSAQVFENYPNLRMDLIFEEAGIPAQDKLIVEQPSYFEELSKYMEKADLEDLKAYLLGQYVSDACGALSDDFYTASWEFFSHQMSGAQEQKPRWKRAMAVPNGYLGEAVGKMYVDRYFPASSKEKMLKLV